MMNVALLSGSDSRKSGGLYNSVRCLADSLRKKQVNARILAHHDEFSEQDSKAYDAYAPISYALKGPANFGYSPDIRRVLKEQQPDVIHTQCLWMYLSKVSLSFYQKYRTPHVISPRGMLDPWAVRHSAWKKKLVATWFENKHLHSAACMHALCESEARAIRQYGLTNPIAIIPNGISLPSTDITRDAVEPNWRDQVPAHKKVLLFLGRIHPKKGLASLIEAWSMDQSGMKNWCLVIAGWDEGGHRAALEAQVRTHGLQETILFVGSQLGKDKAASYLHADAFILPSLSEGLPMSVLEAWSYQLPVLITPQCNLPEGFQANAAVCVNPGVEGNGQALQTLEQLSESELLSLGRNGYALVKDKFTWTKVGSQMAEVYEWILTDKKKPDCIILN
uniref:Glycosyltransferase n=1 Tax=Roseihalotalea indica TaxID=2867963 RepID=A0AA49GHY9_9BACT|nr:glycosyltransferase [Tunicatimonas sp. TK19036]